MGNDDYRPAIAPANTLATPGAAKEPKAVVEVRPGGCDAVVAPPPPQLLDGVETSVVEDSAPVSGRDVGGALDATPDSGKTPFGAVTAVCLALGLLLAMWMFSVMSPFLANALALHGWRCAVSVALGLLPAAVAALVVWRA